VAGDELDRGMGRIDGPDAGSRGLDVVDGASCTHVKLPPAEWGTANCDRYNACARTYIPVEYGAAVKKEDPGVEAFGAFLRAHAVVLRRLEDDLEGEAGVPLGWYDVLLTLERAPGRRLRMQELGDAVVLSRSRVSRI